MKDVTKYLGRDVGKRLAEAAWEDLDTDHWDDQLDRIQAEPRGRHYLDCGARCSCPDCRGGSSTPPPVSAGASHRPCGHRHPGGLRCNRLVKRAEDGTYAHDGAHGAFSATGDYVQWP